MPPRTVMPRDHGSTIPGGLGGNTIVVVIISVIISVIAIGWLGYCCYTRHIGYGVSIDAAHHDIDAGDGYIAVYTPKYTRGGLKRPRMERPPPRREGPRRIVVHQVPSKNHRYRIVRRVVPPQQMVEGASSNGSPRAQKQKGNQNTSNAQQQQKQQKGQEKKKQKGKKNKQNKNQRNNQNDDDQNDQGDNQGWADNHDHDGGWDAPQREDDQQQGDQTWDQGGWTNDNQNDNGQGWNEQSQNNDWQNDQVPDNQGDNGWAINGGAQDKNGQGSSSKKKKKGRGNGAINNQLGWASESNNQTAAPAKW